MANYEKEVISLFQEIASKYHLESFSGQGKDNRIDLETFKYFQFGDLRVELPEKTIIIETESSGGHTNLIKYWYCLENKLISKPIFLIHIYRQNTLDDYLSHLILWEYFKEKMEKELSPGQFKGELFKYLAENDIKDELKFAFQRFEKEISS